MSSNRLTTSAAIEDLCPDDAIRKTRKTLVWAHSRKAAHGQTLCSLPRITMATNESIIPLRHEKRLSAEQKVALAVIEQAFTDAADRRLRPTLRAEARRFIAGSMMLDEWCDVAKVDRAFMTDLTARFLRGLFDVVSPGAPTTSRRREAGTRRAAGCRGHERTAASGS